MLILTRKIGECIVIGEKIKIYVMDMRGKQVRLGIEAPVENIIYREEIFQKVMEENKLAAEAVQLHFSKIKERE
ncbi:MAG: carbon storage regulator CsrA [Thermodesulfobacteriota bacterium]